MQTTLIATIIDEHTTYTFVEVCQQLHIPEALLLEMEEHGLFTPIISNKQHLLNQQALQRIEAACRLHRDLEINLAGVVLALELLDQLEELQQRLAILER
ncbi:MAG: chaperone modulator CbpM [Legionellaceae bacterium]|nr:chaperone modulator CbpM [Legionellaceae bacterium]